MPCTVLGYDDSPGARLALETAVGLAAAYGDELVIGFGFGFAPSTRVGEEYAEHGRALREAGERLTADALARAREAGVSAGGAP